MITLIADCIMEFRSTTGLQPNLRKSSMYLPMVSDRMKDMLLEIIGFQQGFIPFRYLDIPLAMEKLHMSNYGVLIDVIVLKFTLWPKHMLSYTRKLELGKIVLHGVECFWLSILPIPCVVIDKLYVICRSFVWTFKHPSISWTTICLPKEKVGYKIHDLQAWNSALLCKSLWKLQWKKDSLWVKWIHHQCLRSVDLWEWQAKTLGSPLIKHLL